ncbi:histone-lysine N-methyltransferase SETMAR [Trichonephila clavipes]|nr:histone-lysine N-methyltransferase SETMAR [Trichonephila clavipes]
MVLVKEDNLPPLQWSLGRVVQVFPGDDGAVRVVDVKTQRGQFRRPITKQTLLRGFGWDVFGHPSYSPDLTLSDFHLFLHLKSFLAGKHFNNDKELKENVSNWLKTQAATFYEEGIEKLVPRYDTCLQNFGSYVER